MLFPCGRLIPKAGNLNPFEDSQAIAKTKYAAKQINNAHISTVPFTVTMSASQGTKQKLKKKARRGAGKGAGKGAGSQPEKEGSGRRAGVAPSKVGYADALPGLSAFK